MIYEWLADLVVLTHFAFIVFVILGALLVLKRRWVALIHLPAAIWGAILEFRGWYCPLTPLENTFRQLGGEAGYGGGFIEHYIIPIIYPANLTHGLQMIFGVLVILINLVIYGWVVLRVTRKSFRV